MTRAFQELKMFLKGYRVERLAESTLSNMELDSMPMGMARANRRAVKAKYYWVHRSKGNVTDKIIHPYLNVK